MRVIVYTIVFQQLLTLIGFAWTVRVMGFVALLAFMCAAPTLLGGSKKAVGPARSLIYRTAFKDIPFVTFAISQFFVSRLPGSTILHPDLRAGGTEYIGKPS